MQTNAFLQASHKQGADANADVDSEASTDEDYDIISGAEEEDPVSDFEVLSAVSTNNQ